MTDDNAINATGHELTREEIGIVQSLVNEAELMTAGGAGQVTAEVFRVLYQIHVRNKTERRYQEWVAANPPSSMPSYNPGSVGGASGHQVI